MNDAENFKIVRDALRVMEMGEEEQEALFLLVAVVIHLGNIEFASGDGGRARIVNPLLVSTIAKVRLNKRTSFLSSRLTLTTIQLAFSSYSAAPRKNW